MPGYLSDTVMDVLLEYIKTNGDQLSLCSAIPTTYTEAHATYMLAEGALTSADYTLAAGDVSGRKVTIAAQTGIVVTTEDVALYAAITDSGGSALLLYTPCTNVRVYVGNTVNTTAFDLEIQDVA